jgi:hypothetical protein
MVPRAGLDRCGKSRPIGIRSPDRLARSQSLYRLSYPGPQFLKMQTRKYFSRRITEQLAAIVLDKGTKKPVTYWET